MFFVYMTVKLGSQWVIAMKNTGSMTIRIIRQLASRVLSALVLGLSLITTANAAQYELFLTADGGIHNDQILWSYELVDDLVVVSNISTIDVAEAISWGDGGTTGTFNATDIQINYFGSTYDMSDAIGAVTVEWFDGQMVGVNYVTADFFLAVDPSYHIKDWEGRVVVSEVPIPGALVLFSFALGALGGLRTVKKKQLAQ